MSARHRRAAAGREVARLATRVVVDYCWQEELEDFATYPDASHVFRSLVVLESWLSGDPRTPEEYAAELRARRAARGTS